MEKKGMKFRKTGQVPFRFDYVDDEGHPVKLKDAPKMEDVKNEKRKT
jgi:hypothetical protein